MCRNGSLFALFQRERFALIRRRHGCGGKKAVVPVPRPQTLNLGLYDAHRGGRNLGYQM